MKALEVGAEEKHYCKQQFPDLKKIKSVFLKAGLAVKLFEMCCMSSFFLSLIWSADYVIIAISLTFECWLLE